MQAKNSSYIFILKTIPPVAPPRRWTSPRKSKTLRKLILRFSGVSADPVAKHEKFKNKHNLKILLGSDEDHEVLNAYEVWVEKNMYGKKYMGIERATFLIDEKGKIQKIWRKVKVKNHVADVLEAAKAG